MTVATPGPEGAPAGDLVIDAALRALEEAPAGDLDAVLAAGDALQTALTARLGDLGG